MSPHDSRARRREVEEREVEELVRRLQELGAKHDAQTSLSPPGRRTQRAHASPLRTPSRSSHQPSPTKPLAVLPMPPEAMTPRMLLEALSLGVSPQRLASPERAGTPGAAPPLAAGAGEGWDEDEWADESPAAVEAQRRQAAGRVAAPALEEALLLRPELSTRALHGAAPEVLPTDAAGAIAAARARSVRARRARAQEVANADRARRARARRREEHEARRAASLAEQSLEDRLRGAERRAAAELAAGKRARREANGERQRAAAMRREARAAALLLRPQSAAASTAVRAGGSVPPRVPPPAPGAVQRRRRQSSARASSAQPERRRAQQLEAEQERRAADELEAKSKARLRAAERRREAAQQKRTADLKARTKVRLQAAESRASVLRRQNLFHLSQTRAKLALGDVKAVRAAETRASTAPVAESSLEPSMSSFF